MGFGLFFFGGVQRLKEKWRSFQWKSQHPGKGDNGQKNCICRDRLENGK